VRVTGGPPRRRSATRPSRCRTRPRRAGDHLVGGLSHCRKANSTPISVGGVKFSAAKRHGHDQVDERGPCRIPAPAKEARALSQARPQLARRIPVDALYIAAVAAECADHHRARDAEAVGADEGSLLDDPHACSGIVPREPPALAFAGSALAGQYGRRFAVWHTPMVAHRVELDDDPQSRSRRRTDRSPRINIYLPAATRQPLSQAAGTKHRQRPKRRRFSYDKQPHAAAEWKRDGPDAPANHASDSSQRARRRRASAGRLGSSTWSVAGPDESHSRLYVNANGQAPNRHSARTSSASACLRPDVPIGTPRPFRETELRCFDAESSQVNGHLSRHPPPPRRIGGRRLFQRRTTRARATVKPSPGTFRGPLASLQASRWASSLSATYKQEEGDIPAEGQASQRVEPASPPSRWTSSRAASKGRRSRAWGSTTDQGRRQLQRSTRPRSRRRRRRTSRASGRRRGGAATSPRRDATNPAGPADGCFPAGCVSATLSPVVGERALFIRLKS